MQIKRRFLTRSICLVLVLALLPVSTFAAADEISGLQAPVLTVSEITSDSVTVISEQSAQDVNAAIVYRCSSDNLVWNDWREAGLFAGLAPETTYYFQARYVTSDPAVYTDSEPSETLAVTTSEYVAPVLPKLQAPVLSDDIYVVKNSEITVRAVDASKEDPGAQRLYRISKDGINWSDWQTNYRFTGLTGSSVYYFQAMYQAEEREMWADSEPSNTVSFTTKEDGVEVSLRVIGVTIPTEEIDFWSDEVDYKDAVHQNWIQTTTYTDVPAQTNVLQFLEEKLAEQGFLNELYGVSGSEKGYVIAPELFGGQKLENLDRTTGWYFNIYNSDGSLRYTALQTGLGSVKLQQGNFVLLYYVFDSDKEATGAKGNDGIYAEQFLKRTPDAALTDYKKAYGAEDLIEGIGTVTAGSGNAIEAARSAYDALDELQRSLVRNYGVLMTAEGIYAGMEKAVKLDAPARPEALGIAANSIALTELVASSADEAAVAQYRMSADGVRWGDWQESNVFEKLRSETSYYFQARYWPSDLTKYEESEPSEIAEFITTAPPVYTASNREEWVELVVNAPTDGREIVIEIVDDIEVGVSGIFTTSTPGGSNITMVGKGGKLLSPAGGQKNNGICVGNGATLTLRDLEYSSIGPWGEAFGKDQQTGNANFGSMIYLGGSNCMVNLENVTMYGDCTQTGVLIGNGTGDIDYLNNTVNIYSGILDQVGGGSVNDITGYKKCILIGARGCTVNLRPAGDIILEGVIQCDSLRIIPEAKPVKEISGSNGDFSARADLSSDLDQINSASDLTPYKVDTTSCGGVRVIVSDEGTAFPGKLKAPVVSEDMFTVDKANVSVPAHLVSEEQTQAILQYRVFESSNRGYNLLPYQKWMSRPMTFDIELEEDTEYVFELRYNAIGGNYSNSDGTEVVLRTGYTTRMLEAPNLITAEEKTTNSITLKAPVASEQDEGAVAQYRISSDGEDWGAWQQSPAFTELAAGTVYYFQSQFVPNSYLWTTSGPSSTLQIMTRTAQLSAPVLASEAVAITSSSVTLAVPEASAQDGAAAVEYRAAKDKASLATAAWQSGETFRMLQSQTTYYFQARYVSTCAAWLDSQASEPVAFTTGVATEAPAFAVAKVSGAAGETVKVNIYLDGNPGLQAAKLTVKYDADCMTLQEEALPGTVMGGFVPGQEVTSGTRSFVFYTTDLRNTVKNGILVTLEFQIHGDCAEGEYPVTLEYAAEDVYDENDENVTFAVLNGSVAVVASGADSDLMGDVNGDGEVGQKDVAFLIRYLAGKDVTLDAAASDLNMDDAVDLLDLLILRRHLAGWPGYGILPY